MILLLGLRTALAIYMTGIASPCDLRYLVSGMRSMSFLHACLMMHHQTSHGGVRTFDQFRDKEANMITARSDVGNNQVIEEHESELELERLQLGRARTQQPQQVRTLSRTSLPPEDDSTNSPRVRLTSRWRVQSVPKEFTEAPMFGSSKPFCLDPLPTPVSEMLPSPVAPDEEEARVVPSYALFAGR
jgi:hypothetical protein